MVLVLVMLLLVLDVVLVVHGAGGLVVVMFWGASKERPCHLSVRPNLLLADLV